jgi:hypothetical protein
MLLAKIVRYFDINSEIKRAAVPTATGAAKSELPWIPQYLALTLGVFLQPYMAHYRFAGVWDFDGGWGRLLFSFLVAFGLFPIVYKKVITRKVPLIALLGTIFISGLGWQSMFDTATKALSGH